MKRYRYEVVAGGNTDGVNRLLARGWQPVRETPWDPGAPSSEAGRERAALILLEREDAFPVWQGETLGEGVPVQFLDDVPLLEHLSEEETREFIAVAELVRYADGEVLFDEGQQEQSLFVLLEGEVAIHLVGLPIDDPIVLEAKPKDAFGESTFFSPAPHSTRAEAIAGVLALRLTRSRYDELLQGQRPVAFKIAENAARILGQRLQATDAWVRELLQEGQSAQIMSSWRRFRGRVAHTPETAEGFFHV